MSDEERRTEERKRVLLGGKIVFNDRSSVIDCNIRDLSPAGARLVLGHPLALPFEFELEIPSKGQRWRCKVRWYAGLNYGVRFLPEEGGLTT